MEATSAQGWRAKLYACTNDTGEWLDKGTGYAVADVEDVSPSGDTAAIVRLVADDGGVLCNTPVGSGSDDGRVAFRRQQQTIISWVTSDGQEWAMSFQSAEGTEAIWSFIQDHDAVVMEADGDDEQMLAAGGEGGEGEFAAAAPLHSEAMAAAAAGTGGAAGDQSFDFADADDDADGDDDGGVAEAVAGTKDEANEAEDEDEEEEEGEEEAPGAGGGDQLDGEAAVRSPTATPRTTRAAQVSAAAVAASSSGSVSGSLSGSPAARATTLPAAASASGGSTVYPMSPPSPTTAAAAGSLAAVAGVSGGGGAPAAAAAAATPISATTGVGGGGDGDGHIIVVRPTGRGVRTATPTSGLSAVPPRLSVGASGNRFPVRGTDAVVPAGDSGGAGGIGAAGVGGVKRRRSHSFDASDRVGNDASSLGGLGAPAGGALDVGAGERVPPATSSAATAAAPSADPLASVSPVRRRRRTTARLRVPGADSGAASAYALMGYGDDHHDGSANHRGDDDRDDHDDEDEDRDDEDALLDAARPDHHDDGEEEDNDDDEDATSGYDDEAQARPSAATALGGEGGRDFDDDAADEDGDDAGGEGGVGMRGLRPPGGGGGGGRATAAAAGAASGRRRLGFGAIGMASAVAPTSPPPSSAGFASDENDSSVVGDDFVGAWVRLLQSTADAAAATAAAAAASMGDDAALADSPVAAVGADSAGDSAPDTNGLGSTAGSAEMSRAAGGATAVSIAAADSDVATQPAAGAPLVHTPLAALPIDAATGGAVARAGGAALSVADADDVIIPVEHHDDDGEAGPGAPHGHRDDGDDGDYDDVDWDGCLAAERRATAAAPSMRGLPPRHPPTAGSPPAAASATGGDADAPPSAASAATLSLSLVEVHAGFIEAARDPSRADALMWKLGTDKTVLPRLLQCGLHLCASGDVNGAALVRDTWTMLLADGAVETLEFASHPVHMRAMLPVYGLVFAPDDPAKFMRCYYGDGTGTGGGGSGGYVPDLEPPVLPPPVAHPTSPASSDGASGGGGNRAGAASAFVNRPLLGGSGGGGMGAVGGLLHGFGSFARLGAGMGGPFGGGGDGSGGGGGAAATAVAPVLASISRLGAAAFLKDVILPRDFHEAAMARMTNIVAALQVEAMQGLGETRNGILLAAVNALDAAPPYERLPPIPANWVPAVTTGAAAASSQASFPRLRLLQFLWHFVFLLRPGGSAVSIPCKAAMAKYLLETAPTLAALEKVVADRNAPREEVLLALELVFHLCSADVMFLRERLVAHKSRLPTAADVNAYTTQATAEAKEDAAAAAAGAGGTGRHAARAPAVMTGARAAATAAIAAEDNDGRANATADTATAVFDPSVIDDGCSIRLCEKLLAMGLHHRVATAAADRDLTSPTDGKHGGTTGPRLTVAALQRFNIDGIPRGEHGCLLHRFVTPRSPLWMSLIWRVVDDPDASIQQSATNILLALAEQSTFTALERKEAFGTPWHELLGLLLMPLVHPRLARWSASAGGPAAGGAGAGAAGGGAGVPIASAARTMLSRNASSGSSGGGAASSTNSFKASQAFMRLAVQHGRFVDSPGELEVSLGCKTFRRAIDTEVVPVLFGHPLGGAAAVAASTSSGTGAGASDLRWPPATSSSSNSSKACIMEVLTMCMKQHSYRAKYVFLRHLVLVRVAALCSCQDRALVLAGIRFLRATLGVRDDFYNRQFGKYDLLAPVVGALLRSLRRGNAVSSAVFELLRAVCDTAAPHLVDYAVHSFRPIWDTLAHHAVVKALLAARSSAPDGIRWSWEEEVERQACAAPVLPPSAGAVASALSRETSRAGASASQAFDAGSTSPLGRGPPPAKRPKLVHHDDGDETFFDSDSGQSDGEATIARSPLDTTARRHATSSVRGAAAAKPQRAPIDDFEFNDDDDDDDATLHRNDDSVGAASSGTTGKSGMAPTVGLPAGGGIAAASALRSGSASTGGQLADDDDNDGFIAPPRPPSRSGDDDEDGGSGGFRGLPRIPNAAAGFMRRPVGGAPGKLAISISFKKP